MEQFLAVEVVLRRLILQAEEHGQNLFGKNVMEVQVDEREEDLDVVIILVLDYCSQSHLIAVENC